MKKKQFRFSLKDNSNKPIGTISRKGMMIYSSLLMKNPTPPIPIASISLAAVAARRRRPPLKLRRGRVPNL